MEIKQVTVIGAGTMGAGIASAVISVGFRANALDNISFSTDLARATLSDEQAALKDCELLSKSDFIG